MRNTHKIAPCAIAFAATALIGWHNPAAAAIPSHERQALIDLYNYTNGDAWARKAGWKSRSGFSPAGSECNWHGVACNAAKTTVIGINLPANKLEGPLPYSLRNLRGLQYIRLQDNKLKGILPDLGSMKSLREFDVSNNSIAGYVGWANIRNHPSLSSFNIAYNRVRGTLPEPAPARLQGDAVQLCPNLLSESIGASWANVLGSDGRWYRGSYNPYYAGGLYPQKIHSGCSEELPVAEDIEDLIAFDRSRHLKGTPNPSGSGDWLSSFYINLTRDKYKENAFVDILNIKSNLGVEGHPGVYYTISGYDVFLYPAEILLHERPGYTLGGVDVEYRMCYGSKGREPCSEPARIKITANGQKRRQSIKLDVSELNLSFVDDVRLKAAVSGVASAALKSLTPDVCTLEFDDSSIIANYYEYESGVVFKKTKALKYGVCRVEATAAGSGIYAPAQPVRRQFVVDPNRVTQTIYFSSENVPLFAPGRTFRLTDVRGGLSGNPVVFNSATPAICSVSNQVVTMLKAGGCVITASQAGKAATATTPAFAPALRVSRYFGLRTTTTKDAVEDGQLLEFDGLEFLDQDIPATAEAVAEKNDAVPIPVFAPWGLLLVSLATAAMGVRRLRRRH